MTETRRRTKTRPSDPANDQIRRNLERKISDYEPFVAENRSALIRNPKEAICRNLPNKIEMAVANC